MRLRDVLKLRKGDDIVLKHDLGGGAVLHVSHVREFKAEPIIGRYPMIQYTDAETQTVKWCTYLAIDFVRDEE